MAKEFERNIRIAIAPICNMNCVYCIGDNRKIDNRRMAAMEDIRNTPLSSGCISTEQLLSMLEVFFLILELLFHHKDYFLFYP